MLALSNVLEWVNDRLKHRLSAQKQLSAQHQQAVLPVPFAVGDEWEAGMPLSLEGKLLGPVAPVAQHVAKESLEALGDGLTVIGVAGCKQDIESFPWLMDDQRQFEAKAP